ncbi:response regulator [Sulfitobacter sp. R18_1]|nr:response regulator [Sulfitobacter sp. R18_1]
MSEPAHILVVDDHDEIRNSVSSYLERNGMRTSVAESAAEMDAQRARHSFDLIVLDVMMPGEDGLTACLSIDPFQPDRRAGGCAYGS